MAKANFARRPAWMPLLLLAIALPVSNLSAAQDAGPLGAPERAPAGFRAEDIETAKNRWPFTDPEFLVTGAGGGDGAAESRLKALVRDVATDVRYTPSGAAALIAEGALDRPPPDTTLWPARIEAGTFPAPSGPADPTAWEATNRSWVTRHQGNFRVHERLIAALANSEAGAGVATFYVSRTNLGGQAERAGTLIGDRSSVLGEALDAVYRGTQLPGETGREAIARSLLAEAAGETVDSGVLGEPATPDAGADRYVVEAEQLPWEMRLAVAASVLSMRGQVRAATGPVRLDDTLASALAEPEFAYEGFALTAIAVTQFGASTGPRGVYEASALLAFRDTAGRRAIASLVLRFSVADDHILVEDAEAVPLAPATPAATVWYVPARAMAASDLATIDGAGLARLAAQYTVAPADATPDPIDYYIFAFVTDRLAPDAAVELRIGADAEGVGGFPGSPAMLNFDGWPVRVHRATLVLGALPAFHFKVVYRPGTAVTGDITDTPTLLRTATSYPGAPAVAAAPGISPPGAGRAIPNIIEGAG